MSLIERGNIKVKNMPSFLLNKKMKKNPRDLIEGKNTYELVDGDTFISRKQGK